MSQTVQQAHPKSTAAFVLGVLSVVGGFTFFIPIIGMILASMARKTEPDNGMRKWGFGLCIFMLLAWAVALVVLIVVVGMPALFAGK